MEEEKADLSPDPVSPDNPIPLFVVIFTLIIIQCIVHVWKAKHFRSYQITTLIMLWLIPIFISIYNADLHFILIWASVSGLFFYYMSIALFLSFPSNRISVVTPETPRKVYKFFKICSNATFLCAFGGYLFILGLVMLNVTIPALYEWAFIVIFYGLYFGVLGRDLIQLLSDAMAVSIGYHNPEGIPLRGLQASTCAICGGRVEGGESEFFQLNCSHSFHNSCIRGWSILGKNETCPYCKERIDLTPFKENPWQQQEYLYGKFLDLVRYFVVWHPVIFLIGYFFRSDVKLVQ